MLQGWIINIVVSFILRQLVKFQTTLDWAKVKADLAVRVAAIVPGKWFDAEAVALCNALVDGAASVMSNVNAIDNILRLAAIEKWPEALEALKALLLGAWIPTSAEGQKAKAALAAA